MSVLCQDLAAPASKLVRHFQNLQAHFMPVSFSQAEIPLAKVFF